MNEAMAECGPGEERFDMLWVPRGSQPSAEWLAAHPGWVKFPAVMVPRNADGSRRPWAEIQTLLRETDATWGTWAEPLPSPPAEAGATPPGGAVEPADPVGAYLRMARVFDHPAASAGVLPAASKPRQYTDAAQAGARTDAAVDSGTPTGGYVAVNPLQWIGPVSVGSGECVALVQRAAGAPQTGKWHRGKLVRGDYTIPRGTIIATFDADGRYGNHTDGTSHAAIYLGQDEKGIYVIDQWNERSGGNIIGHHTPREHLIPWKDPTRPAVDQGEYYYVVR